MLNFRYSQEQIRDDFGKTRERDSVCEVSKCKEYANFTPCKARKE